MRCSLERRFAAVLALMLGVLVSAATRAAEAPKSDLVKATLLADVSSIGAGQPFTVGVLLEIKPGWHVYWQNAGDAGLPTTAKFIVPEGFTVEPLRYPVPATFAQAGDVTAYGYNGKVILIATVTPPASVKPGELVTISADVKWLSCEKVCIPGQAKLRIPLNVAERAEPANVATFEEWKPRIPVAVENAPEVARHTYSAERIGNGAIRLTVEIQWKDEPREVSFVPGASEAAVVSDVQLKTQEKTTRVQFSIAPLAGQSLQNPTFPAVIAYQDRQGRPRGLEIKPPLDPGGK